MSCWRIRAEFTKREFDADVIVNSVPPPWLVWSLVPFWRVGL